jgi:cell wall-associated NlpC family hydrolase
VLHTTPRHTKARSLTTGRHRKPAAGLAARAAAVAGSTAVAALLATLPAAPVATPAAPVAAPAAPVTVPAAPVAAPAAPVVTAPVVPLAAARPSALTLHLQAVAAAAPAAARASAMQKAMGKIGSPYRYGAAGPNAFDCSGLVNWAFRSTGKSLPRSSRAMSQVGTPVPRSALQPGDLVFFYRPVSHVGIYIGNGKVVHASSRKSPVKVSDMGRMPFSSARRV